MKYDTREQKLLGSLSSLPRKILDLHGNPKVTEFVLHDLCQENCFNFNKAAYLVDNPDFDMLKGVVGVSRNEIPEKSIWQNPQNFSLTMEQSPFNKKVREILVSSVKNKSHDYKELVDTIASSLQLKQYGYCSWVMKHDNHGLLVFEKNEPDLTIEEDCLLNGASLLSFCPIY